MIGSSPGVYRLGTNRKIAHLSGTKVSSVECAHMGWKKLSPYSQDRNAALGMILLNNTEFCSFLHVYESVLFVS